MCGERKKKESIGYTDNSVQVHIHFDICFIPCNNALKKKAPLTLILMVKAKEVLYCLMQCRMETTHAGIVR